MRLWEPRVCGLGTCIVDEVVPDPDFLQEHLELQAGQHSATLFGLLRRLNLEKGEADLTTRASGGWRATEGTLKDASVEFEMVWDTEDAGFTAIKDAYFGGTPRCARRAGSTS